MYAQPQDLINRFGKDELVEILPSDIPEQFNTDLVNIALSDASAYIDSYISQRYKLPLVSTPPILNQITCDIARFYYYNNSVTDEVQSRMDMRINWLNQLAKGEVSLEVTEEDQVSTTGSYTKKSSSNRLFTQDSLRTF